MWQTAKITRLKNHKDHKRIVCVICSKFKISNDNRVCVKCDRMITKTRENPMGKTYKDREKKGLPRVPNWARPKPERVHEDEREKRVSNKQKREERDEWED